MERSTERGERCEAFRILWRWCVRLTLELIWRGEGNGGGRREERKRWFGRLRNETFFLDGRDPTSV